MNMRRVVILLLAAVAAGGAALVVRALIGGGTPKAAAHAPAPVVAMTEVLVAARDLQPGEPIASADARWQKWPSDAVDASFITGSNAMPPGQAVEGTVALQPIHKDQPIAKNAIVKSNAAGFLAATLAPGTRAVSIGVTIDSVAGGFILPNNRVDVILTRKNGSAAHAATVLRNVRVLAIDQNAGNKNEKAKSNVHTATLELTPAEAEAIARADGTGSLSLSLRPLADSAPKAVAQSDDDETSAAGVTIIRYGVGTVQSSPSGD